MLSSIKQRIDRDEEEGFTLIELMVVLLIIAILLAIAIPTFLGARNSANARSTQENLRNALTAEQTTWTNTQAFNASLSSIEPSLTWETAAASLTAGAKDVFAQVQTDTSQVLLMGYAKDNNCYAIYQVNDATGSWTAYTAYKSASSACAVPTTLPSSTAPTAAGGGTVYADNGHVTWNTSW